MAGYNGWSMSNNAVAAYENGEKPLSKWTKADIFNAINEQVEIKCSIEKLKKLPVKVLKGICLRCSSRHHTSSYYNQTDFYALDEEYIGNLTDEKIEKLLKECKSEEKRVEELTDDKIKELFLSYKADKKAESKPLEEKWECAFLEWSGSRKHPKATEVIEEGIVKGNWFYRNDGSKKKTSANGFRFIKQIQ